MRATAGHTPAAPSTTSSTPTGTTNGGKDIESHVRNARTWLDRRGIEMSQSKLSRILRGFDPSEHGGDERALSQWLEARCFDTTGATAAYRVDAQRRARRPLGCTCGCTSPDECVTQRPAPIGAGSCCGAYGLEELAQGIGCPRHTQRRAVVA